MIPAAIGKYRLVRKLAEGGMAEVFLAQTEGPGGFLKSVVVKQVLPELSRDPSFVSMFLNEARLVAQLNHPNIVQVFDFGIQDGRYYLVMEHIDGGHLRSLFKQAFATRRPIPFELVARMIGAACDGLAYAHAFSDQGRRLELIHRDISPENLLIGRNGVVKVADFGIARVAGQARMTRTGTVKGKLVYMAPEQMRGEAMDCRVDVFALGIVLYELICGRRPFEGKSETEAIRAILAGNMTPATAWRPETPVELQRIIERAMATDRNARFRDCSEMQMALEAFIARNGPLANTALANYVGALFPVEARPAAAVPTIIRPPEALAAAPIAKSKRSSMVLLGAGLGCAALIAIAAVAWPREVPPLAPIAEADERQAMSPAPGPPPPPPVEERAVLPAIAPAKAGAVAEPVRPRPLMVRPRGPIPVVATRQVAVAAVASVIDAGPSVQPIAPELKAPPLVEAKPAAPPPASPVLKGRLELSRSRGVVLHNDTKFEWTHCSLRLPVGKFGTFDEAIKPSEDDNLHDLTVDRRPLTEEMKKGWALVRCDEGAGYMWWGPPVP